MSGPTKGMVAGQPIRTDVVTREYAEGHERVFGERKSAKGGRWVYRDGIGLVPIGADYVEQRRVPVVGDSHYDGLRATDGADISSRTKHRQYMRDRGLTTVDDFKGTFERAAREREKVFTGKNDRSERREVLARELDRIANLPQAQYDREVRERAARRAVHEE